MKKVKRDINSIKNKKTLRGSDVGVDFWVLPYGNLMTIMMIFFLILYTFAYAAKTKGSSHYEKILMGIQKSFGVTNQIIQNEKEIELAFNIEEFLIEKGLKSFVKVEINAQRIRITLRNTSFFALGSAELRGNLPLILTKLVGFLKLIPNQVIVEGHTDNIPMKKGGRFGSNWELSAARAFSVIRFFIDEAGLSPDRLSAVGYGEYEPLVLNDTPEQRAMNRRIEIIILRT